MAGKNTADVDRFAALDGIGSSRWATELEVPGKEVMTVCTYALNLSDPGVAGLLCARALLREAGVWVVACVGHGCELSGKQTNQSVWSGFDQDKT